jgi:hypothetical protein
MFVAHQVSADSGLPLPAQPVDVSQSYHKRPSLKDGCWRKKEIRRILWFTPEQSPPCF